MPILTLPQKIVLNNFEITTGAVNGVIRQVSAIRRSLNAGHGARTDVDWQYHLEGALAEVALGKMMGLYWTGMAHGFEADVGVVHEARYRQEGPGEDSDLTLREKDADEHYYWLVTGKNGEYTIHGFTQGVWGKDERFIHRCANRPPLYFVPKKELDTLYEP